VTKSNVLEARKMAKSEELNTYLKNLDIALKRVGKSRKWLSLECGLSPAAIPNMFRRNLYPSVNNAWTISKVLGYPIEDMLKGDVQHFQPAGKTKRDILTNKVLALTKELTENELEAFQALIRNVIDFRKMEK